MDLPENKLTEFIQENEEVKWRHVNNHNITSFSEDDIKRITNDFSTHIGEGGFGQVYRGVLDDGGTVAVKKYIYQNFKQGFAKEGNCPLSDQPQECSHVVGLLCRRKCSHDGHYCYGMFRSIELHAFHDVSTHHSW